jgi:cell shape-determining protein MreC
VCIVLIDVFTGGFIRAHVQTAASFVWNTGVTISRSTTGNGYFTSHRKLAGENDNLRQQLARLEERAASYEVLYAENAALRGLLNLAQTERGITAPIVSSMSASPYGTFLIGAGERDVVSGDLVMSEGGFVIGRVADVSATTALVREVFASEASIDVRIAGASVVAEGHGGGNARAKVPRGVALAVGDAVVAQSLGGRAVGVVGSIESDQASAEQTVYIRLPLNLSSLSFVYVVHER